MENNKWEPTTQPAEGVSQDGDAANVAGQATQQPQAGDGVSTDRMIREAVSAEVQRALGEMLPTVRQDLTTEMERKVQSFSDKAEYRLSQQQQQQLRLLDNVMEDMRETLGPDFERVRNQKRLDILAQVPEPQGQSGEPPAQQQSQQQQQPAQQQSTGQFDQRTQAYIAQRLGNPQDWPMDQYRQINTELGQAQDWFAMLNVVDRWAAQKPQGNATPAQGTNGAPASTNGAPTSAARLQPMGTGSALGQKSIEQLQTDFNKAFADGDYEESERIGKLIDQIVGAG